MTSSPHIIWFLCDQLRPDAVGFMGNPHVRTPNLDRLAASGVVFEQMHVQCTVCMPSRACMLTSRYLRNTGMANGSPLMPPSQVTVQEWLQRHEYATGSFGKLHLTPQEYTVANLDARYPVQDQRPFLEAAGLPPMGDDPAKENFGFQESVPYEDALRGNWHDWLKTKDPELAGQINDVRDTFCQDYPGSQLQDVGALDLPAALHPSMFVGESAAEFFTRRHAEAPCFMHVSFVDPHHPFDPPKEIADTYDPEAIPMPSYGDTGEVEWPPLLMERRAKFDAVTEEMTRATIAYYYAMMETVDMAVGKVIEAVEAAGEMENTIFAFVADHGEFLGSYGLWRKGSFNYDCLIRVPSFISAPGRVEGGRRVAGLTQTIDIVPTLLSLAGQPVYAGMQGDDLAEALTSGSEIGREWTYTEMYTASWGPFVANLTVRSDTAKLTWYPEDRWGQLFDLENDPDERHDLYHDPAHRELRDEMTGLLLTALSSQADPLPHVLSQY